MDQEKMRILKMLEEKKITAEEAARLIEALERVESRPSERELKRRWVHIKVDRDGEQTVNVKVPLALLKFGFKLAPHALGAHAARIERHAERAQRQAERARERAEHIQERIRAKLREKLGPDADLSGLNGDVAEALAGFEAGTERPDAPFASHGHDLLRNLDLDLDKILEMAQEDGFDGKLVDIYDDEKDEHVTITLE